MDRQAEGVHDADQGDHDRKAQQGVGLGLVFGTSAVSALGDRGIETTIVPTTQLAVIALLGALAGVAAAALPARRAARLDVLAAINAT